MFTEGFYFYEFIGVEISQPLLIPLDCSDWIAYFWNIVLWLKDASKLKANNSLIAT